MKPKTVIRKYSDRRLYDASASRYVKLGDIAQMVRNGIEVEVLDTRGKDVTRVVLTQIVVEDARDRETGLPMQLLKQLVMASDHATHEFLAWYLENTLDLYKKAQEAIHSRLSEAMRAVTSPLEYARRLLGGAGPFGREEPEVEQLRRQVEELKAQLAQLKAAAPAGADEAPRPAGTRSRRTRASRA